MLCRNCVKAGTNMRYLLDTNICIYIAKYKPHEVYQRFVSLTVGEVGISIITYGELWYGTQKSSQAERALEKLVALTRLIPMVELTAEASQHYGLIRRSLEQQGTPIGNNDLWIAAHALAKDLILVTNNTREFERVPTLKLENWVNS